ncbi:hypothetical protein P5V34_11530 [Mycobacteroides abscessus subsp. abscessus]|jgi:hypothetical protein|uniref:hypothetical protein n=1 Tax=Mycobacteroides abscessus TaxID=36809 RepID=UPI00266C00CF|nr:hypothetical protein [Mycobacteroides abscessus]MDO3014618.1 hypothetical protein [Mycobacteroides abscessus subsp. abscessus]
MTKQPRTAPDPTASFFAARLKEIFAARRVRTPSGHMRLLTPLGLHRLLRDQMPQMRVSQTQTYRYCAGTAVPRLDEVCAIATVLGISPKDLVPE